MLLNRLTLLLPDSAWLESRSWIWWALAALVGLGFWSVGSRGSRSLIALVMVLVGAVGGKLVVTALSLRIDPMAGTVVGAAALGVVGYVFHRWLLGLALGYLLMAWTLIGFWTHATAPASWNWLPKAQQPTGIDGMLSLLKTYHDTLGASLSQQMLLFGGLAWLIGAGLAVLLPRLAAILFWTLAGATLLLGSAIGWCHYHAPEWFDKVPQSTQGQLIVLASILAAGMFLQWLVRPRPAPAEPKPAEPEAVPAAA